MSPQLLLDPAWRERVFKLQLAYFAKQVDYVRELFGEALQSAVQEVSIPWTPAVLEEEYALDIAVRISQVELSLDLPSGDGFVPTMMMGAARRVSPDFGYYDDNVTPGVRGSLKGTSALNCREKIYGKGKRPRRSRCAFEQCRFELAVLDAAIAEDFDDRPGVSANRQAYLQFIRPLFRNANDYKTSLRKLGPDTLHDLRELLEPLSREATATARQIIIEYVEGEINTKSLPLEDVLPERTWQETRRRLRRLLERLAGTALRTRDVSPRQYRLLCLLAKYGVVVQDKRAMWRLDREVVKRWRAGLL